MKKCRVCVEASGRTIVVVLLVIGWIASPATSYPAAPTGAGATKTSSGWKVGDRVHLAARTQLWDTPGTLTRTGVFRMPQSKILAINPAAGAVYAVREIKTQDRFIGNTWRREDMDFLRVESVSSDDAGWVDHTNVTKRFDISKCATVFKRYPAAVAKCKG